MRIILLDCSGSMGEPFSGKQEVAGRTRQAQAAQKLQAAKIELVKSLISLAESTTIALFEFTTKASLVYEGLSSDTVSVQRALDSLSAGGGTNIAEALNNVSEYVSQHTNAPLIQVLVISDGLSDRAAAEIAARKLIGQPQVVIIINVILIDPTDDGEEVARAIALRGQIDKVTSPGGLADRLSQVTQEQEQRAREVAAALKEYKEEEEAIHAKVSSAERLSFTAIYPGAISPETWYPMSVYLHLARLQAEVEKRGRQKTIQYGFLPSISTTESTSMLQRGVWLRLTPQLNGIIFNPLSQEVAWYEDIQEVVFRLKGNTDLVGQPILGSIDVHCGPVLIAKIPLSIQVRDPHSTDQVPSSVTKAHIFDRIFASYAHNDTVIVDACVTAYEALGIYVYIDKLSLRSGQYWREMLHQFIEKSDLFQLYWSQAL